MRVRFSECVRGSLSPGCSLIVAQGGPLLIVREAVRVRACEHVCESGLLPYVYACAFVGLNT